LQWRLVDSQTTSPTTQTAQQCKPINPSQTNPLEFTRGQVCPWW
jgi:hypothetical protein